MVTKIVLISGIVIAVAIIGIMASVFSVPPTPITCQSPFVITDGQCLCPDRMHETILDDGSKSCKFDMNDEFNLDFCKEFPGECGPRN